MTVVEKIRQLLSLAASTTFAGERDSALAKARLLFNKHRVADGRLRWELLTALGQDAGPAPVGRGAGAQRTEAGPGPGPGAGTAWWEQAEAAEAEWFARWQRKQQASWAEEQKREREADRARRRTQRPGGGRRTKKRVVVRGHWSLRTFFPVEGYARTIVSRPVTFTCQRCGTVVTQQRFPGPTPAYCGEACTAEARREQTRDRVRRYRAARRSGGPARPGTPLG